MVRDILGIFRATFPADLAGKRPKVKIRKRITVLISCLVGGVGLGGFVGHRGLQSFESLRGAEAFYKNPPSKTESHLETSKHHFSSWHSSLLANVESRGLQWEDSSNGNAFDL